MSAVAGVNSAKIYINSFLGYRGYKYQLVYTQTDTLTEPSTESAADWMAICMSLPEYNFVGLYTAAMWLA